MRVAVIPALDEAGSIGDVVEGLGAVVDAVVVVDNGSQDDTAAVARRHGAIVEREPRRGYGAACLRGIARAVALDASVVLFLDADGSDDPNDAPRLLAAVADGADLALGVRTRQTTEPGAMTGTQRFGNWFAPLLMRLTVGARYHDMPPFKAIRRQALERLSASQQQQRQQKRSPRDHQPRAVEHAHGAEGAVPGAEQPRKAPPVACSRISSAARHSEPRTAAKS